MAYKARSQNEPTGTKEIRGQQGTTSKAEKLLAESQNKGRRRSWEIEVIVNNEGGVQVVDHPLAGLTAEERQEARCVALGKVLAGMARRLSQEEETADGNMSDVGRRENQFNRVAGDGQCS